MLHDYQLVPLSKVDLSRERFRISWNRPLDRLEESIRTHGCLQPVLLSGNIGNCEIVSGFRRIEAAKVAGVESVPAVFIGQETSDANALVVALELFLATTTPHPVEQAIILSKLEDHFSREDIMRKFFPQLGLNPSMVIYRRIRSILDMPLAAQQAFADGTFDAACVPYLERLEEEDRQAATSLLLRLRPSKSAQKEMLEYLHDLSIRDGITVEELLSEPEAQKILNAKQANLPQQRDAMRHWLKALRFPVLQNAKDNFEKTCKAWKLAGEVKVVPPPFYEGREYEVRFSFKDPQEFDRRVEMLENVKNREDVLKKLW